ncbi:hypothetical protein [Fictibacillus terranigra]|uniref:Uncharacterized protein n=1 Tax=Fictibacillus terranigra TaxID=3058424 RepID=A0ABT8E0Q6_9BACL|nr:hypothetical protein [Fictibacillus sp. CENA-BCM004]MDN4071494.1 hypothetical protein [Fictibacillus sp. CENA-BCM004]
MKRVMILAKSLCLSIVLFSGVHASAEGNTGNQPKQHMHRNHMWKELAPYKDKLHEKNRLKIQYYELKQEALLKKDTILRLHSEGAWHQNPKMQVHHQKMKKICREMKGLRDKAKAEKKNLKAAMKAKDKVKIETHFDQMLLIQKQVNQKLGERNAVLDSMIKEIKK